MPVKLSADLKVVAIIHIIMGLWACLAAVLVWLAGLNTTVNEPLPHMITAFGLLKSKNYFQTITYTLTLGVLTIIISLCLLQRFRIGWLLMLLLQANGFVVSWIYYIQDDKSSNFYSAIIWSVLTLVFATILIVRRKRFFAK